MTPAQTAKADPPAYRVLIHGNVQGFGFRNQLVRSARGLNLRGWVRNRSDGSVEAVFAGKRSDEFRRVCQEGPPKGTVDHFEVTPYDTRPSRKFKKVSDKLVLPDEQEKHYAELGIKTAGEAFPALHTVGLLSPAHPESLRAAQSFWTKHYGHAVTPLMHLAFRNLHGYDEPTVLPPAVYRKLQRYFNDEKSFHTVFSDKNLYSTTVHTDRQPRALVKRIAGEYFDNANHPIRREEVVRVLGTQSEEAIIKPSRSNNGRGIAKLRLEGSTLVLRGRQVELDDLERIYGSNYVIQEVLTQHPLMARVHPASINTLRMVTVRWDAQVRYLMAFARFGVDSMPNDNAGTGGICVGVDDDGKFLDFAIDVQARKLSEHPTTGADLTSLGSIPNFSDFKEFVTDRHSDVPHHRLISWDICVGEDGQPIFLEHNFEGAMWIYQLASRRSIFGDLTAEILEEAVANPRRYKR